MAKQPANKSTRMKKTIIIVVAALIILVFVGLYFLLAPKTIPGITVSQSGLLPNSGNQSGITGGNAIPATGTSTSTTPPANSISSDQVINYFETTPGTIITVQPDGQINLIAGAESQTLSNITLADINSTAFSPHGSRILINFGTPSNPQTSIFNITLKTWTPLPMGMISPAWSRWDDRIAYLKQNGGGTETIAILNGLRPKAAPQALLTLHAQDLSVAWIDKTHLAVSTKPSAFYPGSLWSLDINSRVFYPEILNTNGLQTLWSGVAITNIAPPGLQFSSGAMGFGGNLSLINTSGNTVQNLTFDTLPSKCVFAVETSTVAAVPSAATAAGASPNTPSGTSAAPSSTTPSIRTKTAATVAPAATTTSTPYLYCGVPRNQSTLSFARLPDDYDQMALYTIDDVYQINLETGAITTVFNSPSQNFDVSKPKVFNNTFFFINRYDSKLYQMPIPTQ